MKTRLEPSVLWREGMFLLPQHLQAFAREVGARVSAGDAVGRIGDYGLISLGVEVEALDRDVFRIERAKVLFRDGTLVSFPETGEVDSREFIEHFTGPQLDVWLGVPAARPNVPQIGDDPGRAYRFRVDVEDVPDENLRDETRPIEFRRVQARLFFGAEDRSGFECVHVARLVRQGEPVARSVLSAEFMPPCLAVGASSVLTEALQYTAERVRGQARDLAARLPALSSEGGVDLTGIFKLQALNAGLVALEQVAATPATHPHDAFGVLATLAGSLAVFGPKRVAPELPPYDHDDLSTTFDAVLAAVHGLLVAEVSVPYDVTEFSADAVREGFYEAEIPQDWLDRGAVFFLGVELDRAPEEVAELVATGLKLLAPDDVDRVLQGVLPGIELEHQRIAPVSFPSADVLHFFKVVTEGASRDAWLRATQARRALVLSALGALGDVRFHFFVELPG